MSIQIQSATTACKISLIGMRANFIIAAEEFSEIYS